MIGRLLTTGCVAAALALSPAERAEADAGEFIGGAIIGGIIGYAAGQNQGQQRTTTGTRVVRPGIPATQQGRETQTALNYFGYDAGAVDGQIGAGTRSAIERFQASMGYPVNGREFASYQFDFLMDGYFWATQQGGAQQTGLRGPQLLYAYRDSLSGAPIQSTAPVQQVQPPATTVIVNPPGQTTAPASTVVAAGNGQLPNLFANGEARMSLANACNAVMLQTSSNGGYLTLATMTDPSQALSEQFCVARTYAMAQGEDLMGQITGLTQAQIAQQCASFSQMLSGEIDRVSLVETGPLTTEMQQFAAGTGIAPGDLAATSRVCLSVGYTQDDMRMAVGSALDARGAGRTRLRGASGPPPARRLRHDDAARPRLRLVQRLDQRAGTGRDARLHARPARAHRAPACGDAAGGRRERRRLRHSRFRPCRPSPSRTRRRNRRLRGGSETACPFAFRRVVRGIADFCPPPSSQGRLPRIKTARLPDHVRSWRNW
jgi:hypothetical protein